MTARVFLCHAKADKPLVEKLYERLKAVGISPWLDSKELEPGRTWDLEIRRVIPTVAAVVVCLSGKSVTKSGSYRKKQGYFQKEIVFALEEAKNKPPGTRFIVPLRLEDCLIPDDLRPFHWVNLFERNGFERLSEYLRHRFASITDSSSLMATTRSKTPANRTQILMAHRERVYMAPFSPSGSMLASASYDHLVKLWNVAERCELVTFEGHTQMVFAVVFSPSGLLLASASRDHTAKIWDIEQAGQQPYEATNIGFTQLHLLQTVVGSLPEVMIRQYGFGTLRLAIVDAFLENTLRQLCR